MGVAIKKTFRSSDLEEDTFLMEGEELVIARHQVQTGTKVSAGFGDQGSNRARFAFDLVDQDGNSLNGTFHYRVLNATGRQQEVYQSITDTDEAREAMDLDRDERPLAPDSMLRKNGSVAIIGEDKYLALTFELDDADQNGAQPSIANSDEKSGIPYTVIEE